MRAFWRRNRWLLPLLLGAGLIAAGLLLGQERLVLQKAVRVCLECIGIG